MTNKIACALLFALIMLYVAVPCCFAANAAVEYSWARITKDGVYLYADEACSKMTFQLEKSYYVQILNTLDNVYQVTVMQSDGNFPSILGYVRKIEATPCEAAPILPVYPTEKIYVTADSAQLRLLPLASSEIVIVATTTQTLNYYGRISYYGRDWYYVYCGGRFGYVDVADVSAPAIEMHPTPLEAAKPVNATPQQPSDDNPPSDKTETSNPTAEILLIVFVVLLAGGLTLAMFLPGNGKKAEVFEQDI